MNPRFGRLPLRFDPAPLEADLRRLLARTWSTHFNTGYHDGGWSGIALYSDDGDPSRLYGDPTGSQDARPTTALAECPAMLAALAALPGPIRSARLLRLAPGSVIREHRDFGLGLDCGLARMHIPIVSHPAVEFYLDGVRVPMAAGECWYLDLGLPHRVNNPGPQERVHLVVDCAVSDALLALLPSAAEGERQVQASMAAAPRTAAERFEAFRQAALDDAALLAELRRQGDLETFLQAVARAGAERGHEFGAEEARAAWQAGRRAWIERHLY